MSPRTVLIAALEREVAPLVRSFRRQRPKGQSFAVFEWADVSVVCGGIGSKSAAAATRWSVAALKPEVVMSVGFAGALLPNCSVGDVVTPATVIDSSTGESFTTLSRSGVLVTAPAVLPEDEKRALATRFHADAVDMEAASVARVAQQNGIPFVAVKVISDELGFPMPVLDRFVDEVGTFSNSKLLAYAAFRPQLWPVLARLGKNAKFASSQLCQWLENHISRDFQDIFAVSGRAQG